MSDFTMGIRCPRCLVKMKKMKKRRIIYNCGTVEHDNRQIVQSEKCKQDQEHLDKKREMEKKA